MKNLFLFLRILPLLFYSCKKDLYEPNSVSTAIGYKYYDLELEDSVLVNELFTGMMITLATR